MRHDKPLSAVFNWLTDAPSSQWTLGELANRVRNACSDSEGPDDYTFSLSRAGRATERAATLLLAFSAAAAVIAAPTVLAGAGIAVTALFISKMGGLAGGIIVDRGLQELRAHRDGGFAPDYL